MFSIDKNRKTVSNLPIITDNLEIIHFDEIPYLYYGTNKYGTKIIGSFIEEDEITDSLRYVHTLVDSQSFYTFINRETPYRSIIEQGKDVFIIDKNINEKPIAVYNITPDQIPSNFLPVEDYYCPKYNFSIGNDFVLSLHGSIADSHLAFPIELSTIQENFEKVINKTLEIFENLKTAPTVKQRAYAPGSFQLRFNLSFDRNDMFINQEILYNTIAKILKDLIPTKSNNLESDNDALEFIENDSLIKLIGETLQPGVIKLNDELISNTKIKFKEIVNYYKEMSSNIGNGYKEIEVLAEKRESKELLPLNLIDQTTNIKLNKITDIVDSKKHKIEVDENYMQYKVCIYSLNTETRKGKALIYSNQNDETMDKPSIIISGSDSLEKSTYTESLHLNKWIAVQAKATLKDGKFNKLNIEGE